ncbi:MAG: queuosine precursor transporter [Candidatus Krumholzibacteria bacterium]|jgi:hypothetical protein|nr:queuosine precursor transporter [Candidatus Krumholzibacteria bacterium]
MSNGLIYILQTLGTLALVLACFRLGRVWLVSYMAMATVMMNLVVVKQISLFGLAATGGNVLYASLYLATDLLSEHWGAKEARRAVRIGFVGGLFFLVTTQVMLRYTPLDFDVAHPHMAELFGFLPRIVLGSLAAFLTAQHLDVWLYHKIRSLTGDRHLWLRNNGSTWISQAVDTGVFYFIAFAGVLPIGEAILFTWILKILIAALDTPFLYWSRKLRPNTLFHDTLTAHKWKPEDHADDAYEP